MWSVLARHTEPPRSALAGAVQPFTGGDRARVLLARNALDAVGAMVPRKRKNVSDGVSVGGCSGVWRSRYVRNRFFSPRKETVKQRVRAQSANEPSYERKREKRCTKAREKASRATVLAHAVCFPVPCARRTAWAWREQGRRSRSVPEAHCGSSRFLRRAPFSYRRPDGKAWEQPCDGESIDPEELSC